jgi:choline transporter-like protein 2/4/5
LIGLTVVCWLQYKNKFQNHQTIEAYTFGFASEDLNKKIFYYLFITLCVLDGLFLLILIFLRSRIQLSIRVIELVAQMFSKVPSLFLLPVGIFVLMVVWWVVVVATACILFGAGTPTRSIRTTIDGDPNSLVDRIDMVYNKMLQGMAIYDVVAFLWGTLFLAALLEMTAAGVVAQWFFTRPEDRGIGPWCSAVVTRSLLRSLRYHTGSLAFGSAIITVCKIVRAILEFIDQEAKKTENQVVHFIVKCLKCCMYCLEKFLKFVNRNAYIIIAIHGDSFCSAARKAFGMILRNVVTIGIMNFVGDGTLFLGRVFVASATTMIGIYLFPIAKPDVQCIVVPAFIVFICSWLASAAFTGTFEMGIDAMFVCYLEDGERNDGSPGRQRYAPEELQRYVGSQKEDDSAPLQRPITEE